MSLPGSIIKKIRDALTSGFREEKLKEILHLNLNITEATYPDGEDYENRVFKLLVKLDAENRIINLIEVAYTKNPGNSNLKILYNKIPKLSLLNILFPLEKQYFDKMKQSYSDCYFINNLSDWEPETVEEILDALDNSKTIQFVDSLINQKLFQDADNKLEEWRTKNINNFVTSQISNTVTNQFDENYLIILISPSQQKKDYFIVKAWIIFDIKHNDFKSPSIEKYQALDIKSKEQETFLFKEICDHFLKDLINQAISKLNKLTKLKNLPTVELFLPYELLRKPIDILIPNFEEETTNDEDDSEPKIPIGVNYKVHIRSYQRIKKLLSSHGEESDEKIILWRQKWSTLQDNYTKICVEFFLAGETNDNVRDIVSKINSERKIGYNLLHLPSKDILKGIDATGSPIALWLMYDLETLNIKQEKNSKIKQEFEKIFDCSISELSGKIKNTRSDAFRNKDHIGNHISLLLDNPYILPPEALPYTQP